MHTRFLFIHIVLSSILILLLGVGIGYAQQPGNPEAPAAPQGVAGTAFTYQGQLKKDGVVVNTACDFIFTLYNAAIGGSAVVPPVNQTVGVSGGLFRAVLDFGSGAFNGEGRWLGIQVKCPPDTSYTPLGRQELTPAPLTLALPGLWTQQNTISPNLIGGYSGNLITSGVVGATISGGGYSGYANNVTDHYGTVGGGANNEAGNGDATLDNAWYATVGGGNGNQAGGDYAMVGGGYDNQAIGDYATVSGGYDNQASEEDATIGGGYNNYASGQQSTIGGGSGNQAGAMYAMVGGGWYNRASASYATVGGGGDNQASEYAATIGGGYSNKSDGAGATVGGGELNEAIGDESAIGGGYDNQASAQYATVGGGNNNIANGWAAIVPGGEHNLAAGFSSFAAGRRAKANYDGCFVWGDSTNADISCGGANQFLVRANGGVTLNFASGALRLLPNPTSPNLIGGYSGNSVTSGVYGATISGGGDSFNPNNVTDRYGVVSGGANNRAGDADASDASAQYATVGGGQSNLATAQYAAVGGGGNNQASGDAATIGGGWTNQATAQYATVGGGDINQASGIYATVGGGESNEASNRDATVSGGNNNAASGWAAIVPGGENNVAAGFSSFAAGRRAKANYDGCFVWGDSIDADISCSTSNEFRARASNGVWFYTNSALTSGMNLVAGGSSWNAVSNRALKQNFQAVDNQKLLVRLAEIPISTWSYKAQAASIRHIGPMADDFNGLLPGLGGEGMQSINSLDADGVALAAIQGLYQQNQQLQEENATLRQQVEDLDQRLAALEQGSSAARSPQASQSNAWLLLAGLGLAGVVLWRRSRTRGGQP